MNFLELIQQKLEIARKIAPEQVAVVIFDLDDTLIDCRHRKRQVFQEIVQHQNFLTRYPEHCERLATINLSQIRFRVSECLQILGIQHEAFEREVFDYWRSCYFTNPYLAYDQAFPLAVEFVQACRSLGVHIVYLTGRDEPGMGEGTRQGLHDLGFPIDVDDVHLILKPNAEQSDVDFKKEALVKIDQIGHVIAAFENEMRNLNMMAEHYPDALMIYRQTLQSPNPPEPHPNIIRHQEFKI